MKRRGLFTGYVIELLIEPGRSFTPKAYFQPNRDESGDSWPYTQQFSKAQRFTSKLEAETAIQYRIDNGFTSKPMLLLHRRYRMVTA